MLIVNDTVLGFHISGNEITYTLSFESWKLSFLSTMMLRTLKLVSKILRDNVIDKMITLKVQSIYAEGDMKFLNYK